MKCVDLRPRYKQHPSRQGGNHGELRHGGDLRFKETSNGMGGATSTRLSAPNSSRTSKQLSTQLDGGKQQRIYAVKIWRMEERRGISADNKKVSAIRQNGKIGH